MSRLIVLGTLLKRGGTELLEVWLILFTLVWGGYLLMPWMQFGVEAAGIFNVVIPIAGHEIVGHHVLGVTFLLLGLVKIWLVTGSESTARWASLLGCMAWLFVFSLYTVASLNTAPAVYGMLVVANVLVYLRRGRVVA